MTTETDEAEYQDIRDSDENLELPHKHLLPIAQEESKRMKLTPFSDLNEDQLTEIFGEGLRLQLCQAYLEHDTMDRDLNLFGTIQVTPDFSSDPLFQNAVFDVFNREFNHPIRAKSCGFGQLHELIHTSFPVSSTSVVQIAAKLYVTTDKLDDVEIYIDDHDRVRAVSSIPRPHIELSDEERRERRERLERVFCSTNHKLQNELLPTLQPRTLELEPDPEPENEVFHVCDDHTFINISDMPKCSARWVRFEGKDGHLAMSYGVFKYAVDAHLELELVLTSTLNNVTGSVLVYYPDYRMDIELFDYRSSTSFITPGRMNLIRSVLAVPANSSFIIKAHLTDYWGAEILSGAHEFHVPRDRLRCDAIIEGEKCYLNLKVNWKLPSEERKIPSSSNLSVERNRWSLQEEIAKVFDTSLKRTFNPQEAVPCSISTCTKEDGGDYICSSVMNIWPEIKNACVYKGPKHAGVAVKNDIVNSYYKEMMERCVVCGPGFVKFKLCRKWIAKCIHKMLTVGIETWAPKPSVKKVVIYYGSRVTPGEGSMSVFRSTNIGETLARMLEYSGVVVRRKRISHMVMRSYYSILDQRLGVDAEVEEGSFCNPLTKEIHDLLWEKGLHVESGGDELLPLELRVWWNALTHALTEEKADWILGVADVRKRVHIERCITAAKRAGLIANDRSKFPLSHVGFGLFPGEKLALVNLLCLLDETKNRCMLLLARRGNHGEWTDRDPEHAAEALGYGAVKYADLKNNRLTDYTFSLDQMLNEEGNTAVYLQFTYVRICSILTSSSEDIKGLTAEVLILKHDDERELGLHLLQFTEVLGKVCTFLAPYILCDYLYGLCKKFNSLDSSVWQDVKVGSGEETSKLLLCKATEVVMRKCFYLLGITPIY